MYGIERLEEIAGLWLLQTWGVNLPPAYVCLGPERGVSISGITRTARTLGRP